MIITCPSCATRYDVDDRRFSPEGRSVRCAECEESWFVPAPQPIEDLVPLKKQQRVYDEEAPRDRAEAREKPEPRERQEPKRPSRSWRDEAVEEDVEEPLFEAAPARAAARSDGRQAEEAEEIDRRAASKDNERKDAQKSREAEAQLVRDRKGRFVKMKKDEPEIVPPSFAEDRDEDRSGRRSDSRKFGKAGRDEAPETKDRDRKSWRDEEKHDRAERDRPDLRADRKSRGPAVVDADFEDIDAPQADYYDDPMSKGFGRKARDERRRETALARLEDLEPVAERIFNEEFFTALRVQPKELERAIRKARRRAEARDKNRLTPLRAIGWSAWVGAIAACAFVAYSYRNNIVAMFPNAKTAYEAVGIEANPYGLKIEGVTHRVAMSPQGPVIEILGRLRNEEKAEVAPPMLQAEALGKDGEVLSRWTFAAEASKVRAGETADFSTRAPAPDGVNEVLLSFAPAEGVKVSVGDLLKTPN
ncbi:MAG: zinc-ribbon domain-containing protein [Pseudomonadota bacterium]